MVTRHRAAALALSLLSVGPTAHAQDAAAPWQVTCYGDAASRSCEAVQTVTLAGSPDPLAQAALGWLSADAPLMLTVVVAPDISLSTPLTIRMADGTTLPLDWNRCRPAGCFAGAKLTGDQIAMLRTAASKGDAQLSFTDGSEAATLLRFPLGGLGAAIDALEKARAN